MIVNCKYLKSPWQTIIFFGQHPTIVDHHIVKSSVGRRAKWDHRFILTVSVKSHTIDNLNIPIVKLLYDDSIQICMHFSWFHLYICKDSGSKNPLKHGFKSFLLNWWQYEMIWNCGGQIFYVHIRTVQNLSKRFFAIHLLYCFDERGSGACSSVLWIAFYFTFLL